MEEEAERLEKLLAAASPKLAKPEKPPRQRRGRTGTSSSSSSTALSASRSLPNLVGRRPETSAKGEREGKGRAVAAGGGEDAAPDHAQEALVELSRVVRAGGAFRVGIRGEARAGGASSQSTGSLVLPAINGAK